jgi:glycosyltransferase involved in cell wall biosynthesis
VSAEVRDSISARWRDRVEVLQHGVDVMRVRAYASERASVRAELGVRDGDVLALTVANLRRTKNYPGLLEAARLVLADDARVRFAAAGQGPMETEIRGQLGGLVLGDRFQLLGYRDDATRLLAGADLFVLASDHEGLPVTVMEALTLGVPVVATAVGGIPEVVRDSENGLLVPPGNPRSLADAITRASDPDLHARLVAGAAATGDRFSSREAVTRLEATYRALAVR